MLYMQIQLELPIQEKTHVCCLESSSFVCRGTTAFTERARVQLYSMLPGDKLFLLRL